MGDQHTNGHGDVAVMFSERQPMPDLFQEINTLATKIQNEERSSTRVCEMSDLVDLGFISITDNPDLTPNNSSLEVLPQDRIPEVLQDQAVISSYPKEDHSEHSQQLTDSQVVEVLEQDHDEIEISKMARPSVQKTQTTRASSRFQEDGRTMMEKAMARKAGNFTTKGIITPVVSSNSSSSNHVDVIASACGIDLGREDEVRIANISLLQAKDEAILALHRAKQKIVLSSDRVMQEHRANDGGIVDTEPDSLKLSSVRRYWAFKS